MIFAVPPTGEVGVDAVLPVWMILVGGVAAFVTSVLTAIAAVRRWILAPLNVNVVAPLRAELREIRYAADRAPAWDRGLQELAGAVRDLARVTDNLGGLQQQVAEIHRQVTVDDGASLKDRVIDLEARGAARHGDLDVRLDRLEAHLTVQDRRAEAHHPDEDTG